MNQIRRCCRRKHAYLLHRLPCTKAQRKPSLPYTTKQLRTITLHVTLPPSAYGTTPGSEFRHAPQTPPHEVLPLFLFSFFSFFSPLTEPGSLFTPTEMSESRQLIFYPTSAFGWEDLGGTGLVFIHTHTYISYKEGRYRGR